MCVIGQNFVGTFVNVEHVLLLKRIGSQKRVVKLAIWKVQLAYTSSFYSLRGDFCIILQYFSVMSQYFLRSNAKVCNRLQYCFAWECKSFIITVLNQVKYAVTETRFFDHNREIDSDIVWLQS